MKIIKLIIIISTVFILFGCNNHKTKQPIYVELSYDYLCIDGIEYIATGGRDSIAITPHFKVDGTLYTCEINND